MDEVTRKFSCTKCCKKFSFKTSLQLHIKSHLAAGDPKNICDRIKRAKQKQPSTVKKQQVPCIFEGCEFVYSSAKKMQSYFMRRHPNREADIADLLVLLEEGLPPLKTYEGDTSSSSEEEDDTEEEQVNKRRRRKEVSLADTTCSYCGKEFRYNSKLQQHIRTHTGRFLATDGSLAQLTYSGI